MIDLLITTFQLMLKGKLFRDPAQVFMRLALCNLAVAATVIITTGLQAPPWLLLLLFAALGVVVPYLLRHIKYQ